MCALKPRRTTGSRIRPKLEDRRAKAAMRLRETDRRELDRARLDLATVAPQSWAKTKKAGAAEADRA